MFVVTSDVKIKANKLCIKNDFALITVEIK